MREGENQKSGEFSRTQYVLLSTESFTIDTSLTTLSMFDALFTEATSLLTALLLYFVVVLIFLSSFAPRFRLSSIHWRDASEGYLICSYVPIRVFKFRPKIILSIRSSSNTSLHSTMSSAVLCQVHPKYRLLLYLIFFGPEDSVGVCFLIRKNLWSLVLLHFICIFPEFRRNNHTGHLLWQQFHYHFTSWP